MCREFFRTVEGCEDTANVVTLVGNGLDAVEGFMCACHWAAEGGFVGVEAEGMTPGEGTAAGHGFFGVSVGGDVTMIALLEV